MHRVLISAVKGPKEELRILTLIAAIQMIF